MARWRIKGELLLILLTFILAGCTAPPPQKSPPQKSVAGASSIKVPLILSSKNHCRLKKAVNELVSSIYSRYCFALIYCLQIMLSGIEIRAKLWEVRT